MSEYPEHVSTYLKEETYEEFSDMAEQMGVSKSELCRRLIHDSLREWTGRRKLMFDRLF